MGVYWSLLESNGLPWYKGGEGKVLGDPVTEVRHYPISRIREFNTDIYQFFLRGALLYIPENIFLKELHFFTVPLSQKFMFCKLKTSISEHH
jgi:hypothetical protein